MRYLCRIAVCLAAAAAVAVSSPLAVAAKSTNTDVLETSAAYFPTVRLTHWKNTASAERHAFLAGFASMLELERAWQGAEALPVSQSITTTWVRGLSGVTLQDIDNTLTQYIESHPDQMDISVVEVLGRYYVRPKMTEAEKDLAAARYEKLRSNFAAQ